MEKSDIKIEEFGKALQLYGNFFCALDSLESKADKYDVIVALWMFGVRGEIPKFSNPASYGVFWGLSGSVVAGNKKYIANVENGKKGGAPKGNQNAQNKQNQAVKTHDDMCKNSTQNNPNELGSNPKQPKQPINKEINKSINKDIDLFILKPAEDGNAPDGHSAPSGSTSVSKSGINWQEMTWQEEFALFEKYFNEQIEKYNLRKVVTDDGPAYLSNEILCPYTKEEMRDAFRRGMDFKEYHEWDGMEDKT